MNITPLKRHEKTCRLVFSYILFDALLSYLGRSWLNLSIPTNAILPFVFLILIHQRSGRFSIYPTIFWQFSLAMTGFSFLLGIFLIGSYPMQKGLSVGAAIVTFIIGYFSATIAEDTESWAKMFLLVGSIYTLVCIIALKGILPGLFPIEFGVWLNHSGDVVQRPSVMTDQNFQVLYLYFTSFPIFLSKSKLIRFFSILASIAAAYVLAKMQTRSGLLSFAGVILLIFISPLFIKGLPKKWLLLTPLLVIGGIAYLIQTGFFQNFNVVERFVNDDYSTFDGRILSALYLVEKLGDLNWWIPRGEGDFLRRTGNIPHFNPTAFFLRGGIFALLGWLILFLSPIVILGFKILQKRVNKMQYLFFVAASVSLIVQLSLNLPYNEQVWIWAGAAVGSIDQIKRQKRLKGKWGVKA